MSEKLEIIVGTFVYDLSDRVTYWHQQSKGFGMAPVKRIMQQGPLQHGATDLGYRLQPRKLQLVILIGSPDEASYWATRDQLNRIFRPSDSLLRLRFTAGSVVRQLDCSTLGLELDSGGRALYDHVVPVELNAPDPTWYDPAGMGVAFGLGGGSGAGFAVPTPIPVNVGQSVLNQVAVIDYLGSWETYPIITIRGPVTNPVLTNETTGDKLDFTGISIASGNQYVIDCRYGYKTVTRTSDGANRVQDLTNDSDLATFRIAAPPDVVGGTNALRVSGTNLDVNTEVYVQFYTRYVGV